MKELPTKEHYCYKNHTSLMKNSATPFWAQPPYLDYPSHFYKKSLSPPFLYDISKISNPWGLEEKRRPKSWTEIKQANLETNDYEPTVLINLTLA